VVPHPLLGERVIPCILRALIRRIQIEELVAQDPSGVTFRALDRETGACVAVNRFFPFGGDGGGLVPEEQAAYRTGIERLSAVSHPALRPVMGGGCDPVDGMPYIVGEWLEGETVAELLALEGALSPAAAVDVLAKALETSELLSAVLSDEAIWVDLEPSSIIYAASTDESRTFTFSLAPLRWLGGAAKLEGVTPVTALAEEILGWRGQVVADHAAGGLGGWVNWLRLHAHQVSLAQAREALATALGSGPPKPAAALVNQAWQAVSGPAHPVNLKGASSRTPLILCGVAAAIVGGLGIWLSQRSPSAVIGNASPAPADSAASNAALLQPAAVRVQQTARVSLGPSRSEPSVEAEIARVNAAAAKLHEERMADQEKNKVERAAREAAVQARGGVFVPGDRDLLLEKQREVVVLEGVLVGTRLSSSGATLYFEFSSPAPNDEPRGYLVTRYAEEGMANEAAYQRFIGKKIRITGEVRVENLGGVRRPEVFVENMEAIQLVE
jgi:hypothetical protein